MVHAPLLWFSKILAQILYANQTSKDLHIADQGTIDKNLTFLPIKITIIFQYSRWGVIILVPKVS